MFGDHDEMRLTVEVAEGSPPAPSPVAATTSGAPFAGDGVAGVKDPLLASGYAGPLLKVTFSVAGELVKPSRISAFTARVWFPSAQRRESRTKVYGEV